MRQPGYFCKYRSHTAKFVNTDSKQAVSAKNSAGSRSTANANIRTLPGSTWSSCLLLDQIDGIYKYNGTSLANLWALIECCLRVWSKKSMTKVSFELADKNLGRCTEVKAEESQFTSLQYSTTLSDQFQPEASV